MRRVVITGMGLRTALGHTPADLFDSLTGGLSAVRGMADWTDILELSSLVAAPITDFNTRELPRKFRRSMGRVAMFGVASAVDAVRQAGLDDLILSGGRTQVVTGSTMGSSEADGEFWEIFFRDRTARGLKSTHFFKVMSHTVATNVAMYLGVRGEAQSTNAACASATQALGAALDKIRSGRADVVIAGGADELHVAATMTFDSMGGGSNGFNDQPTLTPRPFDIRRDGIVVGEGGGMLILEARDHALARGASILAEVLGYGGTSDAVNMAAPAAPGMISAMRLALEDAGRMPSDLDYVNAHATGTPVGDAAEAEALYNLVGDRVPVSSLKGHLGHTLGACGAIEAIACVQAIHSACVPQTLNLEQPDVAAIWLPTSPLKRSLGTVMTTNFAFGGVNTALILGAYGGDDGA
jgi:3-oxoacyl-[acyl-carrier-protein] synthase II